MTRAAVLLTGVIAAAIVARTAAFYRGVDPLAEGLVLLIGLGLASGVLEGLLRAGRAARLLAEVRTLPAPATRESVEAASPPLRAVLLARIAGSPAAPQAAPFTPYLLGLLVMIGLLGTFLGLFETLRGAREALSTSGDVAALRAGLAAPMTGLSRAFGASAAGVSASAMLGLGAVFVRRAEGRVVEALARYAAGPLAGLTVAGRQLAALESLARQGEALPTAAATLREAADRLSELEAHLVSSQAKAAAETAAGIRGTAAGIRADLDHAIGRAAGAVSAAAEPLLARAVARSGAAAGESLAGFAQRMDRDAEERRAREVEQARAVEALATDVLARLEAGAEARARALDGRIAASAAAMAQASTTQAAAMGEKADAALAGLMRSAEARGVALDRQIERVATSVDAAQSRAAEADAARVRVLADAVADVRAALETAATRAAGADAARLRTLEEALTGMRAVLDASVSASALGAQASAEAAARLVEDAGTRLEARSKTDAARDDRLDALISALGDNAEHVRTGAQALASRVDALAEAAEARTEVREARAEERLARLADAMEGALGAQAERLTAFEARLEQQRGANAEVLAQRLAEHARGLGESLRATAEVVSGASDLLRAGSAEMVSVAEMFTGAVDRYRQASDRWLDNLGVIEDAIARRDGGEAADLLGTYLAQTREVFDTSLQFQRELFTELRALRARGSS